MEYVRSVSEVEIKILDKTLYKSAEDLPYYATNGSCAMDLYAAKTCVLPPRHHKQIRTGIAINMLSIPENMGAVILPRSSLGVRGLVLANTVGLIDQDYQGELIIATWNRLVSGPRDNVKYNTILIEKGDRIAQLMFIPILKPKLRLVESFNTNSERGSGGFGSTGK